MKNFNRKQITDKYTETPTVENLWDVLIMEIMEDNTTTNALRYAEKEIESNEYTTYSVIEDAVEQAVEVALNITIDAMKQRLYLLNTMDDEELGELLFKEPSLIEEIFEPSEYVKSHAALKNL